jgi:hypothetical protein
MRFKVENSMEDLSLSIVFDSSKMTNSLERFLMYVSHDFLYLDANIFRSLSHLFCSIFSLGWQPASEVYQNADFLTMKLSTDNNYDLL